MRETNDARNGRQEGCTTSDGAVDLAGDADLETRTYYRLLAADRRRFEPTDRFFDQLESAFVWAYLGAVDEPGVPPAVELAVGDALALTREAFADRPDADLRTQVIPAFYERVVGFHCAYRG